MHTTAAHVQEQIGWLENQIAYLQQRVIRLNLEVRLRDERIKELEGTTSADLDTGGDHQEE